MNNWISNNTDSLLFEECTICPRECGVDRLNGVRGYCATDAGYNIETICVHRGEEPVISGTKGICNVFFRGCNLRCVFCQNHEISRSGSDLTGNFNSLSLIIDKIEEILSTGVKSVGFVSPSHVIPQVKSIIGGLHARNLYPIIVYNTNSYDKAETLRSLDGLIDVYLPDLKYVSGSLASAYSDAEDYPEVAIKAVKEMYFQKGSSLRTDDNGTAENGLLIRHLVLPGHAEESKLVLRKIAEEISTGVNISLMSQYNPIPMVMNHPVLGRLLYKYEYESVIEEMEVLGFRNGWTQDLTSNLNYMPDFSRENPFE